MNYEDRMRIFVRDFFTCQCCGKPKRIDKLQIAHRIKQGSGTEKCIKNFLEVYYPEKDNTLKVIRAIINHPDNLVTACCLECNDSFNIFFNEVERDKLLHSIIQRLFS